MQNDETHVTATVWALMFIVPIAFLAGMVTSGILIAKWWKWRLCQPEVLQDILRRCYAGAHPHWMQVSQKDATPVCSCCGWSEERGHAARADQAREELEKVAKDRAS
jgi:hypothetical protein